MKLSIPALVAGVLASGCSTVGVFENARTMPVGKARALVGVSVIQSDQVTSLVADTEGKTDFLVPVPDLDFRIGVLTHLDLGIRWTVPGNFAVRAKYELIPGDTIAFAIGGGLGYLGNLGAVEGMFPVYLSWDMHEQFGVYGSASYRLRRGTAAGFADGEIVAVGGGIRIGNAIGLMLEANHLSQLNGTFRGLQAGIAFFFGNGPSAKFRLGHDGHEVRWRRGKLDDLGKDHRPYSARVLRVSEKGWVAVVEHEPMRYWKPGEQLCIYDGKVRIGCGKVARASRRGAVVKFRKPVKGLRENLQVRSADDPVPGDEEIGEESL